MRQRYRPLLLLALLILLALWTGLPVVRAGKMMLLTPHGAAASPGDLRTEEVSFPAADGVILHGWFVPSGKRTSTSPVIVLVAGFQAGRATMLPYARFLHRAAYGVLLYDSRGIGASGGRFTLGVDEVKDVAGAVAYLDSRPGVTHHRYGVLGVSLGAGVAIAAAAQSAEVLATVADSAYVDQSITVNRMDTLALGPLHLPLVPLAPIVVNMIIGTDYANFSPLKLIAQIAPRALLLIHSRDDANPTTPLSGVEELSKAARQPSSLWIAPRGGHAGALAAQPAEYQRRVLSFFGRYLPLK